MNAARHWKWKKRYPLRVTLAGGIALVLAGCPARNQTPSGNGGGPVGPVPVRVGWNTTWATEGQIIQCLKHTNIMELNGLKGEFIGFTYGGPLSEAALAGSIDVLSAADQPTITLLSKGADWVVISRCIVFRDAIVVPPKSPVSTVAGLRGTKVAVPFGSGAHRYLVQALEEAGLKVGADVQLVNIDITEINAMIAGGGKIASEWKGRIAAAMVWDPSIANHTTAGNAKVVYQVKPVGLRTMSRKLIRSQPDAPVRFLKAIATATLYYAQHKDQANQWFAEEARMKLNPAVLDTAAAIDSNTIAKSIKDLDLGLGPEQLKALQGGADFAYQQKLVTSNPDMKQQVTLSYLDRAMAELKQTPPDLSLVKVAK